MTTQKLAGQTIAFLATSGVEQIELTSPWEAVQEAGGQPRLVSLDAGTITAMQGDWDHADSFTVDHAVATVGAADFDGLVMPGGTLNADALRTDAAVQAFVRGFFEAGKPVAAICHAPWSLIDAGVARGRTLTSYHSLAEDLKNAGATWVDESVVVDRGLTTSRNPGDLEAFNATLVEEFASGRQTS